MSIRANPPKQRQTIAENLAVSPSVTFDVKNGDATFHFTESSSLRAAEVSLPLDRLIFISHYVRARRVFSSDLQMAEKLGLDRTRLIAWKKGSAVPRQEHIRFLADVATTVDAVRRFLHPAVVGDWLISPQFELGDRTPVEVLRAGRLAEVLQSVNATEHGAYV